MQKHIQILGILQIILGSLTLLVAVGMFVTMGGVIGMVATQAPGEDAQIAAPVIGAIGIFLTLLLLALSIPPIIIGWGLTKMKPWARIWGIVISAVELLSIPIGTAIGIYGLWVLLNRETEALFTGSLPPSTVPENYPPPNYPPPNG